MDKKQRRAILKLQQAELTEHQVYGRLAKLEKNKENKKILKEIAKDEKRHYEFWRKITKEDCKPNKVAIYKYFILSRILGLTFVLKLMERGEVISQRSYSLLIKEYPGMKEIIDDEKEHERQLTHLLKEEKLNYVGSIVLGLNDALVEMLGALAGFSLLFSDTSTIATVGTVTGVAASLSMGASEFLSLSSEDEEKDVGHPVLGAVFTGGAYIATVVILVGPYYIYENPFHALGTSIIASIVIVAAFTYYVAVAKDREFWSQFIKMVAISLSVAAISFVVGRLLEK